MIPPAQLDGKLAALHDRLAGLGSLLVAFSGGADSAFLLAAAARALGPDRVLAATSAAAALPSGELAAARAFAAGLGVALAVADTRELERAGYRANGPDRCFHCKAELLDVLTAMAAERGFAAVATGTNADDLAAAHRPGLRAASVRGAVTPLADASLTKDDVRAASRAWGLPTWDKPQAACLASRIAYGTEVTADRLRRVDRAEAAARSALAAAGIPVRNLRVRDLGDRAVLEVDAELVDTVAAAPAIVTAVRSAGFADATLDPRGFRTGALNETLTAGQHTPGPAAMPPGTRPLPVIL